MDSFPARLKSLREAKKLSQAQLGDLIGRRGQSIYRYEKGEMRPRGEALLRMAEALEVDPRELAGVDA